MINAPHLLNLREFAKYIDGSVAHLGQICRGKAGWEYHLNEKGQWEFGDYVRRDTATKDSPRYYKGLKLPLPVEGDFFTSKRMWAIKDAKEFKSKLEKIERYIRKLNGD